jgi:uncharacterized membrane protein
LKNILKKNLIAGLLVLAPVGLTFLILSFIINLMDDAMSPVIAYIIRRFELPLLEDFRVPFQGFILIAIFIFFIGLMAKNYIGNQFVIAGERLVQRVPFVRGVYLTIQKLVKTFSESKMPSFEKMALIKYPHLSVHSVGFLTCDVYEKISHQTGEDLVNVLLPTVPNLSVGFMIQVPRDQVVVLDMTVEEGVKFLVSIGIAIPEDMERQMATKN